MLALFPRCRSDSQKKRGGVFPHCLTPSFISSHRFLLTLSLSNFEPTRPQSLPDKWEPKRKQENQKQNAHHRLTAETYKMFGFFRGSADSSPQSSYSQSSSSSMSPSPSAPPVTGPARPIRLVYCDEKGKFRMDPEAVATLQLVKEPIGVVSVCGRARQGKSFILNQVRELILVGLCCLVGWRLGLLGL
jgi:hypothetical protein